MIPESAMIRLARLVPAWTLCLAGAVLAGLARAQTPPQTLLAAGDRVVFLGDSNTASYHYGRFIEAFVRLRHPGVAYSFVNVGIGAQTALDALGRIEPDVLAWKPTVVLVNFGGNDASYPADSEHALFHQNIGKLLDLLQRAQVRIVIWASPTGSDTHGLPAKHPANARRAKLRAFADWVKTEGARRGVLVVPWNDIVREAVAGDTARDQKQRLIPDRAHPVDRVHAALAVSVLEVLKLDPSPSALTGSYEHGRLKLSGPSVPVDTAWDGRAPVEVNVAGVKAPVPILLDPPPQGAQAATARALAQLLLRISGLPATTRYRIESGGLILASTTGEALAAGVDLDVAMAKRTLPRNAPKPQTEWCDRSEGHPFLNDYYCAYDMIRAKDALRLVQRSDRLAGLPLFVPGRLERFQSELSAWGDDVDRAIEAALARALAQPHVLRISAVADGT